MNDIVIRTVLPILLLVAAGFISRRLGILKEGDERVLSAYVYYFALPALFFIDISAGSTGRNNLYVEIPGREEGAFKSIGVSLTILR